MPSIGSQVRKAAARIDPIVTDYAVGYFNHLSGITFDAVQSKQVDLPNEVKFVSDLLVDAGAPRSKVDELAQEYFRAIEHPIKGKWGQIGTNWWYIQETLDINVLKSHNSKSNINASLSMMGVNGDHEHAGRNMEIQSRFEKIGQGWTKDCQESRQEK